MAKVPENILKKIQKLLNLAEGAKELGSLAEAENASAKATALLLEYNLSIDSIGKLEEKPPVKKEFIKSEDLWIKNEGNWILKLYRVFSDYNFCQIILTYGGFNDRTKQFKPDALWLIGQEHNRQIVIYLVEQLSPQIRRLSKASWKDYDGEEKKGSFIRGFLGGAVRGIRYKLIIQRDAAKEENKDVTGLILIKDADVKDYVEEEFVDLKSKSSRGNSSEDGNARGYKAGKGMNINKGLNTNEAGQKLIG